jgi:hypothetical protein
VGDFFISLVFFFFGGNPARSCEGRTVPSMPPLPWPTLLLLNFRCVLIFENCVLRRFSVFLSLVSEFYCERVLSPARTYFFFCQNFSMEGTQLGVAKAARFPPSLPFLDQRSCCLILGEFCFLKIVRSLDYIFLKLLCYVKSIVSKGEGIFSQVDRHTTFAMTTLSTLAMTISSAWAGLTPCPSRGNVGCLLTQGSGPRELRSQGLIGAPVPRESRQPCLHELT